MDFSPMLLDFYHPHGFVRCLQALWSHSRSTITAIAGSALPEFWYPSFPAEFTRKKGPSVRCYSRQTAHHIRTKPCGYTVFEMAYKGMISAMNLRTSLLTSGSPKIGQRGIKFVIFSAKHLEFCSPHGVLRCHGAL